MALLETILFNISPIRGIFSKNFFILLIGTAIPLLIGLLSGKLLRKKINSLQSYFDNLFMILSPFLIIFIFLLLFLRGLATELLYSLSFYMVSFIVFVSLGFGVFAFKNIKVNPHLEEKLKNWQVIISLSAILSLVLILNFVPFFNSDHLVGADVYYASSKIQGVLKGSSLFESPYFKGVTDLNYPPVYFILNTVISLISNLSVTSVLFIFSPFYSVLFLLSIFYFATRVFNSKIVGIFSVLFVAIWDKVLFPASGPKNIAIIFLAIFLISLTIESKKLRYTLSLVFLMATFFTHLVYFVIEILVVFFFIIITKLTFNPTVDNTSYKNELNLKSVLLFIFVIFAAVYFSYSLIKGSGGDWQNFLVTDYSEIPLALFNRTGLISILSLIFLPVSLFVFMKASVKKENKMLVLAILLLSINSLFYYTNLFIFHSSIVSEISFVFGIAPLFAFFCAFLFHNVYNRKLKALFIVALMSFLFLNTSVQLGYFDSYSRGINSLVNGYTDEFDLIKENTSKNAVILVYPCDYLARYVSPYTGRYIFSGEYLGKGMCTKRIVTVCGSDRFNLYNCDLRNELNYKLFGNPSEKTLTEIGYRFEVDYLLINKEDPNSEMFKNIKSLRAVGETKDYTLYKYD